MADYSTLTLDELLRKEYHGDRLAERELDKRARELPPEQRGSIDTRCSEIFAEERVKEQGLGRL